MSSINDIVCPPPPIDELFSPEKVFHESGPFELEIGCGKGGFLLRRARENPELRLLGIEWANKYYMFAADRMARWGMTNVRIMRADARQFVIHNLPPECLSVLHVYHPDPWPKTRHHKRRLFQTPFIDAAARALVHGGRLAIQTDHAEYFDWIKNKVSGSEELIPTEYNEPDAGIIESSAQTNFEIKYRREGKRIFSVAFTRKC